MIRHLDGLQATRYQQTTKANVAKRPRRWRKVLFWSGLLIFGGAIAGGIWAQPILAALPMSGADKLALARLAKPGVYLVLFQNQRELRPTGGFLGSFAEVEMGWGGHIKSIQVETNIYQRDKVYAAALARETPEPIREFLGDQPWGMRDSNWALDFPEAAQLIAWFYAHEGGRPVDGVIALDARLLARLLSLTGPITLADQTFTAETVVDQLMTEIEQNYWIDQTHIAENQPKAILADLMPALLANIRHLDQQMLVSQAVTAFREKEVLAYFKDPQLAQAMLVADWDGRVLASSGDYLMINEANLTPVDGRVRLVGAKSSWSIDRSVSLVRDSAPQGGSHHTLTILREHTGKAVWPDGPNHTYLRVAVPAGATLLSATSNGEDISSRVRFTVESGKSVFGLWSRLDPGQKEDLTIAYSVPTQANDPILIQRQPGAPAFPLTIWDSGKERWQGLLERDQLL